MREQVTEKDLAAINAALAKGQDVYIKTCADGYRIFSQKLTRIDGAKQH